MPTYAPQCQHQHEPRFVFVTDTTARSEADPYGDVEGPFGIGQLESARLMLDTLQNPDGRFRLAFVYADGCRRDSD